MLLSKKKRKKKQGSSLSRGRNEGAGGQRDDENIHVRMLKAHRLKEVFGILKVKVINL